MTHMSSRALKVASRPARSTSVRSSVLRTTLRTLLLPWIAIMVPAAWATTPVATVTSLSIASPNNPGNAVPYKTPVTLIATVTTLTSGTPVTSGLVLFCDAGAPVCENNSALALVQLTAANPNSTATLKVGSGDLGSHSYKAVYRANNLYDTSTSAPVSYTVTGTYASTTTITPTGNVGDYTLTGTVAGVGDTISAGPTGTVSFLDASAGDHLLGSLTLGTITLSTAFAGAPGSPFDIATSSTTDRSVAIASAYLDTDNNLDVVTGDYAQTITVLLGKGDGTFQPKVTYDGCPTGIALKIVLADFNRDGKTDVALGCSDGNKGSLTILLGKGDGTFGTAKSFTAGDVAGIATGDFNSDGILDFAVSNKSQQNIMIFTGKGDGTFNTGHIVITPSVALHDVVVADFNSTGSSKGTDDLLYAVSTATPSSQLSDLYLATGNGDGTFNTPALIASNVGEFLTAGDTNSDTFPDVVSTTIKLAPNVSPSLFVLIGNGDGTFQPTVTYTSDIPSDPHLADVNGDGKADIIAGGSFGALVYQGKGDGTFKPYSEPRIGGFAFTYAVNAGDYNNDGNSDLIGTDAKKPQAAVALSQVVQSADAAALKKVALMPLGSGTHNVDASYEGDHIYMASISATTPLLADPAPTTLTLSVSPTSGTLSGQPLSLSATLSPYEVGPPHTTTDGDPVNFYNGATLLGTGTLNSGVATLSTSALPVGSDPLSAVFPTGDDNYLTSTSSTINVTVSNIVLSSSLNPSPFAQSITFTAKVIAGETGSVTFYDGATALGTSPLNGTIATYATSSLNVATHNITATYNGDGTHGPATSPVLYQEIDKATPKVLVATSGPSTYGASVTITATVPATATGTISFTSGSGASTINLGSGTISSNTVSISTTALPTGSDTITATYSGDVGNNTNTGIVVQTVGKATPILPAPVVSPTSPVALASVTITENVPVGTPGPVSFYNGTTPLGTGTIVSGVATLALPSLPTGSDSITASTPSDTNNNPATSPATAVTVTKLTSTVTVTSSGTGPSGTSTYGGTVTLTATVVPATATGNVTFTSGGITLGTGNVNASGIATATTIVLPAGTDTITATYNGDPNYNSASATASQIVSQATATVTVTSSGTGPSGTSTFGGTVTLTATVVPATATGTVTFTSGGATLGTGNVNASGIATTTTTVLPAGTDTITATYNGDPNYNSASGTASQIVSQATATVTVTSLGTGPSGTSSYGGTVTLTATVVPSTATGNVTFTSGGITLGTGNVNASGIATTTTIVLPVGTDTITATYNGDINYTSASAHTSQIVSQAASTVTVTSSGTGPAGTSSYGGTVTLTATVVPSTATGNVTFTSGGITLGTGNVNASGIVTTTTIVLPAGTDTITASYSGDPNYNSASGTASQIVNKISTTSSLNSSVNPSPVDSPVTFTDTILPTDVTGTVTFTNGPTVIGTASVTNGVAAVTISTLPGGSDSITATYNGDTKYGTSVATLTQTVVGMSTPTVTVTTSGPTVYGGTVTITTSVPPGTTGTITVTSNGTPLGSGTVSSSGTVVITTSTLPVGNDPIVASYSGDTNNNPATGNGNQTIIKDSPTLVVTSSSNPSTTTQPVTFTGTLPTTATGAVTFTDGTTVLGTAPITNGVATITVPTLPAGTNTVTATYSGDTNNNSAISVPFTQTVNKTTPVLPPPVTNPSSTDTLTSITITEQVPAGVTGPVTFSNGTTVLGTAPINNGVATLTIPPQPAGTDSITASTPSDPNNNAATSLPTIVTIVKVTPVLPPPSVSTTNPAFGAPVIITETIPNGVTGPITFYNGTTIIGTASIVNGVATITVSTLPLGTDSITASSPANAIYNAATSPATQVTVAKGAITVTLTSSVNPAALAQSVTFTALASTGATGSISFRDGVTVLGVGAISASGIATFTTSTLTIGTHPVTAAFDGDTNFSAGTSAVLNQVISKVPSAVAVTQSSPIQLLNSLVTFTANVTTPNPTPTGTVTFYDGAAAIGTAPLSTNGTAVVSFSNNGDAAYSTTTLAAGSHVITASYSGDSSFMASTSAPLTNIVADFTNKATGTISHSLFPGDTASYTFVLSPVGSSTFLTSTTLDIDGLPKGTTYSFSPAVIPAGAGPTTVTLTVTTSKSLTAENHAPAVPGSSHPGLPIALSMLGLAGIGAVRRHKKQMPRLMMLALLAVASLLPIAALTGCAGGYFALNPTKYNIQVTGTEGPIQHTATTTLIVQ